MTKLKSGSPTKVILSTWDWKTTPGKFISITDWTKDTELSTTSTAVSKEIKKEDHKPSNLVFKQAETTGLAMSELPSNQPLMESLFITNLATKKTSGDGGQSTQSTLSKKHGSTLPSKSPELMDAALIILEQMQERNGTQSNPQIGLKTFFLMWLLITSGTTTITTNLESKYFLSYSGQRQPSRKKILQHRSYLGSQMRRTQKHRSESQSRLKQKHRSSSEEQHRWIWKLHLRNKRFRFW